MLFEETFTGANDTDLNGYNGWNQSGTATWTNTIQNNEGRIMDLVGVNDQGSLYRDVSSLYTTTLDNETEIMQWGFTFGQVSLNAGGAYQMGFVVGGSDANFTDAGNGYAISLDADTDGFMFGRYTGGLGTGDNSSNAWANMTYLIGIGDPTDNFRVNPRWPSTARVDFNPVTGTWSLYTSTNTTDPSVLGAGDLLGSVVDTTYTGGALDYMGLAADASGTANRYYEVDNIRISDAVIPEPMTIGLLGVGLAILRIARRKRG